MHRVERAWELESRIETLQKRLDEIQSQYKNRLVDSWDLEELIKEAVKGAKLHVDILIVKPSSDSVVDVRHSPFRLIEDVPPEGDDFLLKLVLKLVKSKFEGKQVK